MEGLKVILANNILNTDLSLVNTRNTRLSLVNTLNTRLLLVNILIILQRSRDHAEARLHHAARGQDRAHAVQGSRGAQARDRLQGQYFILFHI